MLFLALALSLVSLIVSLIVGAMVLRLAALRDHSSHQPISSSQDVALDALISKPLAGMRIAVSIEQDHPHAPFFAILREQLFAEDVADVQVIEADKAAAMGSGWKDAPDLLVFGHVVCNGYSDVYYEAELMSYERQGALCTLIEKPPHGDRPSNLALKLVTRMKRELEKETGRKERRQAIQELGG